MNNFEKTLSIIKPDAVERNLENEIKKMFDTALEEKLHKVDEITDSLTDTKKKYARYLLMNIEEKAEILTKDITSTKVSLREGIQKTFEYIKKRGVRPFDYNINIEIDNESMEQMLSVEKAMEIIESKMK